MPKRSSTRHRALPKRRKIYAFARCCVYRAHYRILLSVTNKRNLMKDAPCGEYMVVRQGRCYRKDAAAKPAPSICIRTLAEVVRVPSIKHAFFLRRGISLPMCYASHYAMLRTILQSTVHASSEKERHNIYKLFRSMVPTSLMIRHLLSSFNKLEK